MQKNRPLNESDLELIRTLVWRRQASLMQVVRQIGHRQLSTEEREAIRGVLLDEMLESGLQSDDEPNEYGKRLDQLIGVLRNY